ncbi:dTDP-4-dehydrorhamnose reductase [Rheinheimera pacifica]|uniref:dTDP-4-dehydrorhamnose reductase n=1 Tax=Rheinheimera pacifica TaxID=173990 RepID=A0A1H6MC49_9GAMM|nr:dTDP-4-dehydrorhamnose reductase [Rheinheimera pacifica]SEH99100.1 dTDP-4-dehydrorhamnose reductase [Rheinheimera pacifica]
MKLLLLGAKGQLGQALLKQLQQLQQFQYLALSRGQLDITDLSAVATVMAQYRPDVVINCAAYTAVDNAEQQAAACIAVNATAVGQLARLCQQYNSLLLQFSTDYVFNGQSNKAYTEQDIAAPLNVYGHSKLQAEHFIQATCSKYVILRTSWLFSEFGHNFYRTMLTLAQRGQVIQVVNDQFGCPTYAGDLAAAVLQLLQRYQQQGSLAYGIYHLAGSPAVSWYQFAEAIFAAHQLKVNMQAVSSTKWASLALRPGNSVLNCDRFANTFSINSLAWGPALDCLVAKFQKDGQKKYSG